MAYDSTIPAVGNIIRTSSGDVAKMRENFQHLEPVATSGIHGLVSGGSVASGAVAVSQGAAATAQWHYLLLNLANLLDTVISGPASGQALGFDGSDWVNRFLQLSNLSDVSGTDGASNGEVLKYNGTVWAPGEDTGGAGGGGGAVSGTALLRMPSGATQSLSSSTTVFTAITGLELAYQDGPSWAIEAASGVIEVPSGLSHIQVIGQIQINGGSSNGRGIEIWWDGTADGGVSGLTARQDIRATGDALLNVSTPLIPTSGIEGRKLQVAGRQGSGGPLDVEHGVAGAHYTWLNVVGYNTSGSAAGSTGGFRGSVTLQLPSGTDQTLGNGLARVITGMQLAQETGNISWGINPASGIIEVPSGVTHVKFGAQVRFQTNATGGRRLEFRRDDGSIAGDSNVFGVGSLHFQTIQAAVSTPQTELTYTGPMVAVSGTATGPDPITGSGIMLVARQDSGGNLDVEWGGGTNLETFWTMEVYNLD